MIKVSIVGASSYTGGELIRLLLSHPQAEISQLTSRTFKKEHVSKAHPNLRNINLRFSEYSEKVFESDLVFLCLPHNISMEFVPALLNNTKVIDLSADFRLKDPKVYKQWYRAEHTSSNLLEKTVYGIPELHREEIKNANLIACAGCEATAIILALAPLKDYIKNKPVVTDIKIGSSAAGRTPTAGTHFSERANTIRPYAPEKHRHALEVKQEIGMDIMMSAHAVDLVRGILTTNHIIDYETSIQEVRKIYKDFYKESLFIRIMSTNKPKVQDLPNPKYIFGSNYCDIGFAVDGENSRLVVISALDNLIKGSAGQAIQCMNLMFRLEEGCGLRQFPIYPI